MSTRQERIEALENNGLKTHVGGIERTYSAEEVVKLQGQ